MKNILKCTLFCLAWMYFTEHERNSYQLEAYQKLFKEYSDAVVSVKREQEVAGCLRYIRYHCTIEDCIHKSIQEYEQFCIDQAQEITEGL